MAEVLEVQKRKKEMGNQEIDLAGNRYTTKKWIHAEANVISLEKIFSIPGSYMQKSDRSFH